MTSLYDDFSHHTLVVTFSHGKRTDIENSQDPIDRNAI